MQEISKAGIQNGRGRYLVCAEKLYVNQFVVQLSNESFHASQFDVGRYGFHLLADTCQQNMKQCVKRGMLEI